MTEFRVEVVRLGKIGKHPNADNLSITQVHGYPCIFRTGDFVQGDLAVHVPVDAIVPTDRDEFRFLSDKATNCLYRVKATKIRGVPSYGLLVQVPLGAQEGQEVRNLLGVTKYEPGPAYQIGGDIAGRHISLPQEGVIPYYDIEGLRRFGNKLVEGEEVVISEKIHGANGRWVVLGGQLLCGSRTKFRANSVWNRLAERYRLQEILGLPENEGLVLYGEVYGRGIQDLTYGCEEQDVRFFDLYDTRTGTWVPVKEFYAWCVKNCLPTVPVLYFGPYNEKLAFGLAEGHSLVGGASHVREGIVIKPVEERWDQEIGRVFLKLPGEGYLLRKQGNVEETKDNDTVECVSPVTKPDSRLGYWSQLVDLIRGWF